MLNIHYVYHISVYNHVFRSTGRKLLEKCELCDGSFAFVKEIREHMKSKHPGILLNVGP